MVPLAVSIWGFNTRLRKVLKRSDKNNGKLKILYKLRIKAHASAFYMAAYAAHIPLTKVLIS